MRTLQRLLSIKQRTEVLPLLAQPAYWQRTTLLMGTPKRISRCVHAEAMDRTEQQFLLLPIPLMCLIQ